MHMTRRARLPGEWPGAGIKRHLHGLVEHEFPFRAAGDGHAHQGREAAVGKLE
jgi:hypothetical protein